MADIHNLPLTTEEGMYLVDILDSWIDGYEEVKEDIINDGSLDTPEDLLLAAGTADDDISRGKVISVRLKHKLLASLNV